MRAPGRSCLVSMGRSFRFDDVNKYKVTTVSQTLSHARLQSNSRLVETTVDDMLPEGAESWVGKRDEEITVSFDQPGYYGFKCKPHEAMGMVGLIRVGDPDTVPGIGKLRGKGDDRMQALLAQAGG